MEGEAGAAVQGGSSVLFQHDELDPPDALELKWTEYYKAVCQHVDPVRASPDEVIRRLVDLASSSKEKHSEVVTGLVFGILADPDAIDETHRILCGVERDNGATSIGCVRQLCKEKCVKLLYTTMQHMMMIVDRAATAGGEVAGALVDLIRLVRGGDVSDGNVWASNAVLTLVERQWKCVVADENLITVSFFSFLRLAADHNELKDLQTHELEFCRRLWEHAPKVCARAGRDAVRALQDVARHPAVEQIWRSILSSQGPVSLDELLRIQCPASVLASRLTAHTERQIMFLMKSVRREGCARHQGWFAALHLANPQRDTLICDLIRYVVSVYHPSNRVISSDVIPRYMVIKWLLTCITTNYGAQNAKLALFIDWFTYKRDCGKIMLIEPAVLLIKHAVASDMKIAATLLEFLCLISKEYLPPAAPGQRTLDNDFVCEGIKAAIVDATRLGVISSASAIFLSPDLDARLRARVAELFGLSENRSAAASKSLPGSLSQHQRVAGGGPPAGDAAAHGGAAPGGNGSGGRSGGSGSGAAQPDSSLAAPPTMLSGGGGGGGSGGGARGEGEPSRSGLPPGQPVREYTHPHTSFAGGPQPEKTPFAGGITAETVAAAAKAVMAAAANHATPLDTASVATHGQPSTQPDHPPPYTPMAVDPSQSQNSAPPQNPDDFETSHPQHATYIGGGNGGGSGAGAASVAAAEGLAAAPTVYTPPVSSTVRNANRAALLLHFSAESTQLRAAATVESKAEAVEAVLIKFCDLPADGINLTTGEPDSGVDYSHAVDFVAKAIAAPVVESQAAVLTDAELTLRPAADGAFWTLCEMAINSDEWGNCPRPAGTPGDRRLVMLLAKLLEENPRIGFFFLCYLAAASKLATTTAAKTRLVKAYCAFSVHCSESLGLTDFSLLAACICRDLKAGEGELRLIFELLPFVYSHFHQHAIVNADILHCFVSVMDAAQLHRVRTLIHLGQIDLFIPEEADDGPPCHKQAWPQEDAARVLAETLKWETFEQICVWELCSTELTIRSPERVRNLLENIIPHLTDGGECSEAVMGVARVLTSVHAVGLDHVALLLSSSHHLGVQTAFAVLKSWLMRPGSHCNHLYSFFDAIGLYCTLTAGQHISTTDCFTKLAPVQTAPKRSVRCWPGSGRYWIQEGLSEPNMRNPLRPVLTHVDASWHALNPIPEASLSADQWKEFQPVIWETLSSQLKFLWTLAKQDVLKQIGLELYNPTLEKRVLEVVNSRQCPKTWSLWLNDIFPNLHAGVAEADAAGAAKDAHKGPKITDKAGNFVSFNDAKTLLMRYKSSSTDLTKFRNFATKNLNLKIEKKTLEHLFGWWKGWNFTTNKNKRAGATLTNKQGKKQKQTHAEGQQGNQQDKSQNQQSAAMSE